MQAFNLSAVLPFFRTGIGSACAIALLAWCDQLLTSSLELTLLIGSFGASAVLLFGTPQSPLAQPRNVIGGHIVSAAVGVAMQMLLGTSPMLAACAAVSCAIILMQASGTLHPPGGASALIAVIGGDGIHALGWQYVFVPCALGALCMVGIALIVNNIGSAERWPNRWL